VATEELPVARGHLLHSEVVAGDTKERLREVELLEHRPIFLVAGRIEQLRRITDRDPADWDGGACYEARVDVDDGVDPYLGASLDA
jgi:hypothetical protein